MPPKRPPPLPKSLFTANGPLSHAADPHPPAPDSVHPAFIIDAHTFGQFVRNVDPPVPASVTITLDNVPVTLPGLGTVSNPGKQIMVPARLVTPTLPGTNPNPSSPSTIDLIVPPPPNFDDLDATVNSVDGGWSAVETSLEDGAPTPKVLVAGLLPPPLGVASAPLLQSESFNIFCGRLGELSLHSDVVLKALPPVVEVDEGARWWEDEAELGRVVKMYLARAIETFGTHRIVFGSSPALPVRDGSIAPVTGKEWYLLLRRCLAELGEDADAMTAIMGGNAKELYAL